MKLAANELKDVSGAGPRPLNAQGKEVNKKDARHPVLKPAARRRGEENGAERRKERENLWPP